MNSMSENIEKKMQKTRELLRHVRQKMIVRVWNLAKRLDPKQIKKEEKKKKGKYPKLGNQ